MQSHVHCGLQMSNLNTRSTSACATFAVLEYFRVLITKTCTSTSTGMIQDPSESGLVRSQRVTHTQLLNHALVIPYTVCSVYMHVLYSRLQEKSGEIVLGAKPKQTTKAR